MAVQTNTLIQRVLCNACGWNGGRVARPSGDYAPCSTCGGDVAPVGPSRRETRFLMACVRCGWFGPRGFASRFRPCAQCEGPCVRAQLVDANGVPLPYADGQGGAGA